MSRTLRPRTPGEWTRQPMDLPPQSDLAAVFETKSCLVGLGWNTNEKGGAEAALWSSTDGRDWHSSLTLGSYAGLLAIPWKYGVLVTASDRQEPLLPPSAWHSDDGKEWSPVEMGDTNSMTGVAFEGGVGTDDGILAWGRGPDGPGLWRSRSGSEWVRSELTGEVDLIVPTAGELLAFGKERESRRAFLASSPDGVDWSKNFDGARSLEGVAPASVVAFQGGMVLAGSDLMQGIGAVLVSDDGRGWYRVPFQPATGTSIEHLATLRDRLLAVGADNRKRRGGRETLAVWQSSDGVVWEEVVDPSGLLIDSVGHSVTVADGRVRIWGSAFGDGIEVGPSGIPVHWEWTPSDARSHDEAVPQSDADPAEPEVVPAGAGSH